MHRLGRAIGRNAAAAAATAAICLCLAATARADRLHLTDGTVLQADAAWEEGHLVWFRRGGVTQSVDRARVRSIERTAPPTPPAGSAERPKAKLIEVGVAPGEGRPAGEPVRIYFVGGARAEVDEATESAAGVWYRRGSLSVFVERARVERVERGAATASAAADSPPQAARVERAWTTGRPALDALIRQSGARYGVDPYLIFCVMEQESHFNARAVSHAGARGLMQLMPGTARRFGVRAIHDPAQNIEGGTRYLKELIGMFDGRLDLVLAGYNAGEGAVMKYGRRVPPYAETRNYVRRIGARYGNPPPAARAKPAATPAAAAAGVEE